MHNLPYHLAAALGKLVLKERPVFIYSVFISQVSMNSSSSSSEPKYGQYINMHPILKKIDRKKTNSFLTYMAQCSLVIQQAFVMVIFS